MPSSIAKTTARAGRSALTLIDTVSPGLTLSGAASVTLAVRFCRLIEKGTTPYETGLRKTSGELASRKKTTDTYASPSRFAGTGMLCTDVVVEVLNQRWVKTFSRS